MVQYSGLQVQFQKLRSTFLSLTYVIASHQAGTSKVTQKQTNRTLTFI